MRIREITEIVGPLSSGRTSLLTAALAGITGAGGVAALVDADDAFDPRSAARAGVDLRRLLWVRGGGRRDVALHATDVLIRCPGFRLVALDVGETPPRLSLTQAFRFRLAVRRRDVALVISGRRRIAGAAASLVVESVRDSLQWAGPASVVTRLAGMRTRQYVVRDQGASPTAGDDAIVTWWAA